MPKSLLKYLVRVAHLDGIYVHRHYRSLRTVAQKVAFGFEVFASVACLLCGLSFMAPVRIVSPPFTGMDYVARFVWGACMFALGTVQLFSAFDKVQCIQLHCFELCLRSLGAIAGGFHWAALAWYLASENLVYGTGWNSVAITVYGLIAFSWAVVWSVIPEDTFHLPIKRVKTDEDSSRTLECVEGIESWKGQ